MKHDTSLANEQILGYIVTGWNGSCAMALCDYGGSEEEPEIILAHGDEGTLFPTYDAARNALRRTAAYRERTGHGWDLQRCRIQRLVTPLEVKSDDKSFELLRRMIQGPLPENNGCLEWPRARKHDGYGKVRHNGKYRRAHRLAFELAYGPIAPGLQVLHKCDNPPCFRPDHLFLGTNAENRADSVRKGRHGNQYVQRKANGLMEVAQ
jgi:hypothetical protein